MYGKIKYLSFIRIYGITQLIGNIVTLGSILHDIGSMKNQYIYTCFFSKST